MPTSKRRWIIAIAAALYLYFLLPATADMFFALYHLTHIDPIYWGYSGFKAAGYYFGIYEHRSAGLPVAGRGHYRYSCIVQKAPQSLRGRYESTRIPAVCRHPGIRRRRQPARVQPE